MNTTHLKVGDPLSHPVHGNGTVSFVGEDYLGIVFDGGGEALIRRESLDHDAAAAAVPLGEDMANLPWPDSTFVAEPADTQHFLGSHWEPFAEDANEILGRLPEIASKAMVQAGYGERRPPPRAAPADWPPGFMLVWPDRSQGLAMTLRPEEAANMIVSIFPFSTHGSQTTLLVQQVTVWAGGLEAQVSARWGEGEVSFFDIQYPINRAWYEAGRSYDFILAGLAYTAGPARKHEWQVDQHPDQVEWMNRRLKDGEAPYECKQTIRLDGAALLLPVSEWDVDDYSFHAPVKSVAAFTGWLGQDGWRVRATVMRFDDVDADLDILITRRAWSGDAPPQVGQDIEGRLWLQGSLWMPGPPPRSRASGES